jgi:uncharacterized NAD(P)/FAD-binding protein YdhS
MSTRDTIVVVGGGASGVILTQHLLRSANPSLRVVLVERRSVFGRGVAYSASLPDHLLNVSAQNMSALADDPGHFLRWLSERGVVSEDAMPFYAPRSLYGAYLGDLLDTLVAREPVRLRLVNDACLSVAPTASGVEVKLANGTSIAGHVAVLAVGHDQEPSPAQSFAVRMGSAGDTPLDPDASVLILGTGLSMVDAWLTLQHRGHKGEIVALSRRGVIPLPHRQGKPLRLDRADIPLGTELSYFVGWFRDLIRTVEKSGGNWRDVVDGVRPFNQLIWQNWPVGAKRRFLEHTKAWWDIHRHRMAPAIHERIGAAIEKGGLKVIAGRLVEVVADGESFDVVWLPRQGRTPQTRRVGRVYDCTGIVKDVSVGSIAVVRSLTDRGHARPDPLRLGVDVTTDCAIVDEHGKVSEKLFAVGPLTRGTFFEIDAVPDIRVQCAGLARRLAG